MAELKIVSELGLSKLIELIKSNFVNKTLVGNTDGQGIATLVDGKIPLSQLGNIDTNLFQVVTDLPQTDIKKVIYLKQSTNRKDNNSYAEYLYTGELPISETNVYDETKWEKLGEVLADVDLSNVAKLDEANTFAEDVTTSKNIVAAKGQVRASGVLVTDSVSGVANGIKRYSGGSSTVAWTTDGSTIDLSGYAQLMKDTYPFDINSFTSSPSGILEVGDKDATVTPTFTWSYKNEDKNAISSLVISCPSWTSSITVDNSLKTIQGSPVKVDKAGTHTFTLTAKGGDTTKTKLASIKVINSAFYWIADSNAAITQIPLDAKKLTAKDSKSRDITFSPGADGGYPVYVYPKTYGTVKIYDSNNFDNTAAFDSGVFTVDVNGESVEYYYVVSSSILVGTGILFKFV